MAALHQEFSPSSHVSSVDVPRFQEVANEIISHIAGYIPKHLCLRLVNSRFDTAIQELHTRSLQGCTTCRCKTNTALFFKKWTRLPFISDWGFFAAASTTDASSLVESMSVASPRHLSNLHVSVRPTNFDLLQLIPLMMDISAAAASVSVSVEPMFGKSAEPDRLIQYLLKVAPLVASLKLIMGEITSAASLSLCQQLSTSFPRLSRLELPSMNIGDNALQVLASSSNLQSSLTRLSLENNCFSSAAFTTHFCQNSHFQQLREFILTANYRGINDSSLIAWIQSPSMSLLSILEIRRCYHVSNTGIQCLISSPSASNLQSLVLTQSPKDISAESVWMIFFALNSTLGSLKELNLSTSATAEELSHSFSELYDSKRVAALRPSNLEKLRYAPLIEDEFAHILSSLPVVSNVKQLEVWSASDAALAAIFDSSSSCFQSLESFIRHVSVSKAPTPMTWEGIHSIVSSSLSHKLTRLVLSIDKVVGDCFDSECGKLLSSAPHFQKNLKELRIWSHSGPVLSLSEDVVTLLSSLKSLELLEVSSNSRGDWVDLTIDAHLPATDIAERIRQCLRSSASSELTSLTLNRTPHGKAVQQLLKTERFLSDLSFSVA